MQIALDSENKRITATTQTPRLDYYCPACGGKVHIRKGEELKPHFGHNPRQGCQIDDEDSTNRWHQTIQELFPEETREVVYKDIEIDENRFHKYLENDYVVNGREIPAKKEFPHRADISTNTNYIIEFQHSSIDAFTFATRTHFYNALGKKVIWIFHIPTLRPINKGKKQTGDRVTYKDLCDGVRHYTWVGQTKGFIKHFNLEQEQDSCEIWFYFTNGDGTEDGSKNDIQKTPNDKSKIEQLTWCGKELNEDKQMWESSLRHFTTNPKAITIAELKERVLGENKNT